MATVKAVAIVTGDPKVRGTLQFLQDPKGGTNIRGRISGLSPGLHGFHIHALGDTTNGCNSTGHFFRFSLLIELPIRPHFNPLKKNHGAPSDNERHAGDLGNIVAGPDGVADISIRDMQIPLTGQHSILGRAVVVHADPDDLGKGGHDLSKTTGNAGARVGCGIIGLQSSV
ncbi:superoxide dismutase [Cu-Zn] 2 isoform X1 [Actinidia eriantha]|uniref:superoxide dismutase [Cu-Zn] 2 isoform X1 n=1 Tax=Actinidia eriantha TaxID=165200 RepID=UPI002589A0DD|nr:superoxide dismutase [Cu-Zn] 2 isoform X1 [Actinidia eriantha]